MSATSEQMIGKTIASVRERDMAGRDTFKDLVTWTMTEITFTDGTQVSFGESDAEVYDVFEYDGCTEDGEPIPVQVRGCSCGMADYGAPGHDGDPNAEPDEDDLAWAREDLGPHATEDEVRATADRRAAERATEEN